MVRDPFRNSCLSGNYKSPDSWPSPFLANKDRLFEYSTIVFKDSMQTTNPDR